MEPFAGERRDYDRDALTEDVVAPDPMVQLERWLADAVGHQLPEPTAATLATVDEAGRPDARTLLLRSIDRHGVRFYTNRRSPKGRHLAANPFAALVLYWQPLERQARLRGPVEQLPDEDSDAYFASRPRESQLGAWASQQSEPVADRATLEAQVEAVAARFADREVPRPAHWGGYLLRPDEVEFWQGRPARLHDRLRYRRGEGGWHLERLQP